MNIKVSELVEILNFITMMNISAEDDGETAPYSDDTVINLYADSEGRYWGMALTVKDSPNKNRAKILQYMESRQEKYQS